MSYRRRTAAYRRGRPCSRETTTGRLVVVAGGSLRKLDDHPANWNTGETGGAAPALWDVADNETDAETVLDARFDYRFETANGGLNVFFNINDLLDSEPEDFLTAVYSSNVAAGTGLGVTGENRGRRYTLGVRMSF